MSRRSGLPARTVARVAGFVLLVATAVASGSEAQDSRRKTDPAAGSRNAQIGDGEYRLTMPIVRKLLAPGAPRGEDLPPMNEAMRMSNRELAAALDRNPAAKHYIAGTGLSTMEYAAAWKVWAAAEEHLMREGLGQKVTAHGVRKANVDLLRANRAELEELYSAEE